ncbi:hypothetical protein PR003_g30811 [Phytophthora rubi]|uniref:Uncharacterized protein n=1 Tax=Phytophthora rubi TaxID=129364 RepID=A0A6A3HBM7_9STRA|nr:hypothetical protein PR001_g31512 [Phytophthora rubi]KAE8966597.1 hypothetical protein PR002_g28321 [Phytophthora rubi]KAE9270459.1 hypothetical protein PR003_g30811 [Phytophthora rubi]
MPKPKKPPGTNSDTEGAETTPALQLTRRSLTFHLLAPIAPQCARNLPRASWCIIGFSG